MIKRAAMTMTNRPCTMIHLEIQKLSPVPTLVSKEVRKVQIRHFLIELTGKRWTSFCRAGAVQTH